MLDTESWSIFRTAPFNSDLGAVHRHSELLAEAIPESPRAWEHFGEFVVNDLSLRGVAGPPYAYQ